METTVSQPKHGLYFFGVGMAVLSFATFLALNRITVTENQGGLCFINYAFFVILLLTAFLKGTLSFFGFIQPHKAPMVYPLIVAGTISCFALNKEVSVFYDSCTWLSYVLVLINIVVLFIPFLVHIPRSIRYLCFAVLGLAWLIYLYFSIILIPLYPIGLLALIALGLGIHIYMPFICFVALTVFLIRSYKEEKGMVHAAGATVFIGVLFVVAYMSRWNTRVDLVNSSRQEMNLQKAGALPEWVRIAQIIPADNLTKKVLLSDIMFAGMDQFWGGDFGIRRLNLETERVHDPLITLSSMTHSKIVLSDEEVIKVLEAKFDIRHLTESRLWTGRDLTTNTVTTNVRIYPGQRLAYTEKILTVENNSQNSWEQDEAIYTFYLPESATVSSLSLWINGVEEKAALTTKGKADSAYTSIVGVERRDPSVVHWKEGNAVSVRVFPCLRHEPRQFKIGITSPLEKVSGKLVYKNIYFKGPDAGGAQEIVQVNYTDDVSNLDQPGQFKETSKRTFRSKHSYNDSWKVSFDATPVKANEFQRGGRSYKVEGYVEQIRSIVAAEVYLDVNAAWTSEEWTQILQAADGKKVYVFTDGLEIVTNDNREELFHRLQQNQFSLFPFYEIKNPETAVVVTKSNGLSPSLAELKGTIFSSKEKDFFGLHKNIRVLCIQSELSPYLKTLQEFRAILLHKTSAARVASMIRGNIFPKNPEDSNCVYIAAAGITIREQPVAVSKPNTSPDHVYRLYGYNTVLRQLNTDYYMQNNLDTAALATASDANVVSPISSLIVLETQADYDRFGISKNPDGLGNASIHADGSVPEPHEWVLIILATISLWYIYNKRSAYVFRRH